MQLPHVGPFLRDEALWHEIGPLQRICLWLGIDAENVMRCRTQAKRYRLSNRLC